MKSHIYIIRNKINNKVYIGQTTLTLEERFKKHIYDSKGRTKHRPLYIAFDKYGIENFYIELIEDCATELADEREQFWIKKYNSYRDGGYNATIGGSFYEPYDYDYVANLIKSGLTTKEIVKKIGCCKQLVYRVANSKNLELNGKDHSKKVGQYTLDYKLLNIFNSEHDAAVYIKDKIKTNTQTETIRKNISKKCNSSKYDTAYNYKWKFIIDNVAV